MGKEEWYMLLVEMKAILKWNPANRIRYENLGYTFTQWKDEFLVEIGHLTSTTRASVYYECDYCGEKFKTDFKKYNHNLKRSITKKDACENCINEKIKESSLDKYGVDSPNKSEIVKDKKKDILNEKYGVDNVSQIFEVKEKVKNTVRDKYGVNNVFQSDEVISKMKITKYNNKSVTTSKPQIYINSLLEGKLNYPVGKCSIDIALLKDKIAIEYDGGGHELHVKFNDMTKEEFDRKEFKREYFLINRGWKILRIVSKKDFIPSDDEILSHVKLAIDYLKNGRSWVRIDIDNNKIYGSKINKEISFSYLRKIKGADVS
jgi:very-short-patch-repair endonuclease